MAHFTNILPLLVGAGLVALIGALCQKSRILSLSVLIASVMFFAGSSMGLMGTPTALAAPQNAGQPEPEQQLQAATTSSQYIGLEYVQGVTPENAKGDQEIIETIEDMNDNLVVQSSNGSVFLSGKVDNRQTARSLVDSTKQIPGVIQVSYELGLDQD
ncbi:transport-associated protein [Halothece sp. PCC 7418]|uniref:BON domain-containing protein n=1 Tax=Halothece sp. (strain PCC 7418) TaxID=65093 RepID=UPI0002A07D87|nr:BON domain-containing protein [Halothece sp. PCC 7418]AFZ43178.1 transport-associated protein [Halothece sp. PCC 7418]